MDERFVINDGINAINFDTNETNVLKEDVIYSFELASRRKDCNKVEVFENETKLKYKLSFKDSSSYSIIMNKIYYKANEEYIERLEDSVQAKKIILNNKVKQNKSAIKRLALAGVGITIIGGIVFAPKIVDSIIENDNAQVEQYLEDSGAIDAEEQYEENINHSEVLKEIQKHR